MLMQRPLQPNEGRLSSQKVSGYVDDGLRACHGGERGQPPSRHIKSTNKISRPTLLAATQADN